MVSTRQENVGKREPTTLRKLKRKKSTGSTSQENVGKREPTTLRKLKRTKSTSSTSHENVGKRGPTTLRKLKRKNSTGEKLVVEWNSVGQAIGENRSTFMSYIGVCARSLVDINIPRWDHVPKEIKESLWTDISDVFEVPANKQDWVIAIACDRWRSFKTKLKRFMYDKDGNICPNPPPLYSFINQETWDKYITTRQSDEFKEQSERHREIAKKNIYTYRGSRKGYVGIEEEIVRANKENNNFESPLDASSSTPSVSRSLLWKKARINKDGNMDEPVRQVVAKMDRLSEQVAKGEITLSGRRDILTTALGTEEHAGRVRGVGDRVTITKYFGRDVSAKCSSQLVERFNAMEEQVTALKSMVTELLSPRGLKSTTMNLQNIETWEPIDVIARSYSEFPEGWTECELASPEPGNPIVATGKVFNTNAPQPVMLHNKPLEPGYMKVTVIDPKVEDAPLPMPTDEAYTVFEAVGAFVAWPRNLIFRNTMESQLPSGSKDARLGNQRESLVSKKLVPVLNSQSNPFQLVSQIAAEINDDNIATMGRKDKDEGLSKRHESTVSRTLTPVLESQSTPLNLISQVAAKINDKNISTKGKKVKGKRKQIKSTQPKTLAPTQSTQPKPSQGNQVAVHQQQSESLASKASSPVKFQSNPLHLISQIAAEISDDNIATTGKKDEGLSKQHESTVSRALNPALESQSTPLDLVSQFAAEINDNNISTKGEKVKGTRIKIKRTQPQASTPAPSTQQKPSQGDQVAVHQQQKLTTLTMKLMYRCVRGMTCDETITVDMPPTIWLCDHTILITKDNLLQWLFQENVQVSHVSVYIKYLSNMCKGWDTSQMFTILRPQILTPDSNRDEDKEAQYIADAMKGSNRNQIHLAPYYNRGHWMLCAIHPLRDQGYWLDPAGKEANPEAKKVVQLAIRKFYSQRRRKKPRSRTEWFEIKCPHQLNDDDSGYYVLRYMEEIIEKRQDSIPEQYYEDAPGVYEQHHIDEIRDKWVEFVQSYMD